MMALVTLATATPPAAEMISIGALVMLLTAMGTFVGTIFKRDKIRENAKREVVALGPQPFIVQMREEFATRRELEKLENTMSRDMAEIKGINALTSAEMKSLFRETMAEVKALTAGSVKRADGQHERLTKKIEDVASGAYQSRGKIHQTVNNQGERISKLEATSDVAGHLGKLATALNPPTKIQPVHQS